MESGRLVPLGECFDSFEAEAKGLKVEEEKEDQSPRSVQRTKDKK